MSLTRVLETSFALSIVLWSVVGGGWWGGLGGVAFCGVCGLGGVGGVVYIYIYSVHPSLSLPPSLSRGWRGERRGREKRQGETGGQGMLVRASACVHVHPLSP